MSYLVETSIQPLISEAEAVSGTGLPAAFLAQ